MHSGKKSLIGVQVKEQPTEVMTDDIDEHVRATFGSYERVIPHFRDMKILGLPLQRCSSKGRMI